MRKTEEEKKIYCFYKSIKLQHNRKWREREECLVLLIVLNEWWKRLYCIWETWRWSGSDYGIGMKTHYSEYISYSSGILFILIYVQKDKPKIIIYSLQRLVHGESPVPLHLTPKLIWFYWFDLIELLRILVICFMLLFSVSVFRTMRTCGIFRWAMVALCFDLGGSPAVRALGVFCERTPATIWHPCVGIWRPATIKCGVN
jgi:hypothetical protein